MLYIVAIVDGELVQIGSMICTSGDQDDPSSKWCWEIRLTVEGRHIDLQSNDIDRPKVVAKNSALVAAQYHGGWDNPAVIESIPF